MSGAAEAAPPERMTLAEFLAWSSPGDSRWELVDGQPVMMNPPKLPHVDIAQNIGMFIGLRLRSPCRVGQGVGVLLDKETDTYLEADVAVSCEGRRPGQQHFEAPRLIAEIPSPSTKDYDIGNKAERYRFLPSVEELLLVSSTGRHVTHWRREAEGWHVQDVIGRGAMRLGLIDEPLDLDTVYADVVFAEE